MENQEPNPVLSYATPATDMGSRAWVLLRTYGDSWEANLAAGKLRAEGIPCTIADENIVTSVSIYTNATGGIKLMVMPQDLEAARAILPQGPRPVSVKCPKCNATTTREIPTPLPIRLLGYAMLGLPWLLFGCAWQCDCGHRWRRSIYAQPDDEEDDNPH